MCGWGEGVWSMRAVDFTATPESYAVCPYAEHVTYVAQRCVGWARVNCPLGRGHGDLWPAARIGSLPPVDPSGARILCFLRCYQTTVRSINCYQVPGVPLQRLKSGARMPWLMERYVFNACLCHVLAKSEFWSPNWCLWIWPDDKFAKVKILYPAKIATKPKHDIVRPSNINVHQSAPLVWLQDSEGVGETLKFGWIGSQFF